MKKQKNDHSLNRNDRSLNRNDQSLSKNDYSLNENDQSLSKNDHSLSKNDHSLKKNDQTLPKKTHHNVVYDTSMRQQRICPTSAGSDLLLSYVLRLLFILNLAMSFILDPAMGIATVSILTNQSMVVISLVFLGFFGLFSGFLGKIYIQLLLCLRCFCEYKCIIS